MATVENLIRSGVARVVLGTSAGKRSAITRRSLGNSTATASQSESMPRDGIAKVSDGPKIRESAPLNWRDGWSRKAPGL
jgi:hypothetical protein